MKKPVKSPDLLLPEVADFVRLLFEKSLPPGDGGADLKPPDVRTIRWYQTSGLVDRPTRFRGAAAVYGRSDILRLAAIKQLQRSGCLLEEIRTRLAGNTDEQLAEVARTTIEQVDSLLAQYRDAGLGKGSSTSEKQQPGGWEKYWHAFSPNTSTPAGLFAEAENSSVHTINVSPNVALCWSGKALSAEEIKHVRRLAEPLVSYLSSRPRSQVSPKEYRKQ